MQLSIVIVNYNSRKLLENCIASLQLAIKSMEAEVIIIDNNSTDDSWDYIKNLNLTGYSFRMNSNFGFATACNAAYSFVHGNYILFLNPDTIVSEKSLTDCISFFESHAGAGAVGVRMVNEKGEFLKESKRGLPTPATSFYKLFGLTAIFPGSKTFAKYYQGHLPETENNAVDVLSGAFMMIKKEAFEKVNGFDESFFMYGEDIDISFRIMQAGFKNYYLGKISVTHLKGGSTTYNQKYIRDFYGAMNLFVKKHYSHKPTLYRSFLYTGIGFRKMLATIALPFR